MPSKPSRTPVSREENVSQGATATIDKLFEATDEAPAQTLKDTADIQKGTYYGKFVPQIQKRDGTIVPFDFQKIVRAIGLAMEQTGEGSMEEAEMVAHKVVADVVRIAKKYKNFLPTVEGIQDEVERQLILSEYVKTAKHYIIYREERARMRKTAVAVPERVRKLAEESSKYFEGNPMGEFVYLRTYARWIESEGRRETWIETVDRYVNFMRENLADKLTDEEYAEVREAILKQEAMPSMRLMQFSGAPARRCNAVAYNCSFIAPTSIEDFGEVLYLSASGCGVGFAAESKNIEQLPQIKAQTGIVLKSHVVEDSKEGWAGALVHGMKTWYDGKDVQFDYSQIRPAGARLKTMGGKASGPEPLRSLMDFARAKILARQNRRLRNIDAHDILCKIGEAIVSGGVRRSAMISLSDLDDDLIRHAKDGAFYNTEPQRMLANNSAVYETKPSSEEFMEEWMALMKGRSGERGIFNRGGLMVQTPKRRLDLWDKQGIVENGHIVKPVGTNPCLTGDTLVYTADGRGHVRIDELAQEGKDVPVFCLDASGSLAVRYMRNPRVTGRAQDVYKVTLDDGSTILATKNHAFRLRTGEYREVGELQRGDSLHVLTRYEASIKDIFPNANARSQDYWWVNNGRAANIAEHRAIAAFHYNNTIPRGYVVHHKDRNAQNNTPSNLEIMSKSAHDALHADLMRGDNNPMRRAHTEWTADQWSAYRDKHAHNNAGTSNKNYSGVTNEELREHALTLTRSLGRRFSTGDWLVYAHNNALPQHFSKWRCDHLGGMAGFAKFAAFELGYEDIDADPRVVASLRSCLAEGYDATIENGHVAIRKTCEVCGGSFVTGAATREHGICGMACAATRAWRDEEFRSRTLAALHEAHATRKGGVAQAQAQMYADLKFTLGREPLKREWIDACRERGVSTEISRASSPCRSYEDLKERATMINHKVITVEYVGTQDVYNGTVDEFHNFFVGAFEGVTRGGKRKYAYLNNRQCGEIILQSKQFCNLSEVIARRNDTLATLKKKARIAAILGTYQSSLTRFNYLSKPWTDNCQSERLLGVSVSGQWDSPEARKPEVLRAIRDEAVAVNKKYAKRFGIPASSAVTAVKPSGTVSQTVNCSSGMHPRHSEYYIRRIRISATDSLFKMLKDQGIPHSPEVGQTEENANTYVLEFPVKSPKSSVYNDDLSAIEQLECWKIVKENYTEHNPSVTISIGDDEWVAVANWLYEHWEIIGGLSFLPRSNHSYRLAPYEAIDKETYEKLAEKFQNIDYSKIVAYEMRDETEQAKELACAGGTCEIS